MGVVSGARQSVIRTADAATSTAGAVGGAVVNGALGAIEGAVTGVAKGVKRGGNSSVAAALTIVTIGAIGLVEWPIVAGIGGGALLIHKLGHRGDQPGTKDAPQSSPRQAPPRQAPPRNPAPRKPASRGARPAKAAPRTGRS